MVETLQAASLQTRESPTGSAIRRIGVSDLWASLREGWDDFRAIPTQLVFLCILYPIIGLVFARSAARGELTPLLFPLAAGFALVGPLFAVGIYELSRRREQGLPLSWVNVFDVARSPQVGSVAFLGVLLGAIFVGWMVAARAILWATMGQAEWPNMEAFWADVLGTPEGWSLIVWGNLVGAAFASLVLAISVISFPALLDRDIRVGEAVGLSLQAVAANPLPMALWGAVVAGLLALGSVPLFVGLAVVLPVLGHATWHLYRKVVV